MIGISYVEVGKYIIAFDQTLDNKKTKVYELCNSQDERIHLGEIKYNSRKKEYCLYTRDIDDTIFNSKCLTDILKFINYLNLNDKIRRGVEYEQRNK